MGPHRTQKALILALGLLASPACAQQAGWHYSPLPGEGDRAALGCDRNAMPQEFTCLAVRCEDDFSTGLYLYSSRFGGTDGTWAMTLDREDRSFTAVPSKSPYGAQIIEDADFLLDRLRHGTFIYMRHSADENLPFAYIDLSGSMAAITEALFWCAPRVPPAEQNAPPNVKDNQSRDFD